MSIQQQMYVEWLEKMSSHVQASSNSTLLPAIAMLSVLVACYVFTLFRAQLRYLPILNIALVFSVFSSFQACSVQEKSTSANLGPINHALPPGAGDLGDTLNHKDSTAPGSKKPGFNYLVPKMPKTASELKEALNKTGTLSTGQSVNDQNYLPSICNPEFQQYLVLNGVTKTVDTQCEYVEDEDQVKEVLQTCKVSTNAADPKHLVFGLKLQYWDTKPGLITVTHGEYFPVLTYCVDGSDPANLKIKILNPNYLDTKITSEAGNFYSSVEKLAETPGWYQGNWTDFENDMISSKSSSIELNQKQGDIDIGQKLSVKVVVRPDGFNAKMPEFRVMNTYTDTKQELIRGGTIREIANVATGEMSLGTATDMIGRSTNIHPAFNLNVMRTYRSFFAQVSDFGYNWDASFPRRKYYSLGSATTLEGTETYEFLFSGDARVFFVPGDDNEPGPFWDDDDNTIPDVVKSGLFQKGRENIHFNLAGQVTSKGDRTSGNRVYYLYDGGQVVLTMDWLAALNSPDKIRKIVDTYKQAEASLRAAGSDVATQASARVTAQDNIRNTFLDTSDDGQTGFKGNWIYYYRNDKGYIVGTIDRAGMYVAYSYDNNNQGDRLVEVHRYVRHDPLSTGTVETGDELIAKYTYETPTKFGDSWRGLITGVENAVRTDVVSSVNWVQDVEKYGEAPVVKSFKAGATTLTAEYNFSKDEPQKNKPQPTSTSTFTDNFGRNWKYTFNWAGVVLKLEGPDESNASTVLMEALWDPKLLNVVNTIARGVESYSIFDDQGNIQTSALCADRDFSGNRIVANIGTLTSEGLVDSTSLKCESEDRRLRRETAFSGEFFQHDYFINLGAAKLPTQTNFDSAVLPNDNGVDIQITRTNTITYNGCFGSAGEISGMGVHSATYCYQNPVNGGAGNFQYTTGFENYVGGDLKSMSGEIHPYGDSVNNKPVSRTNFSFFLGQTNQIGFINRVPLQPMMVYTPYGYKSLSDADRDRSSVERVYDHQGNVLLENHPMGAYTVTTYDYRGLTAIPVFSITRNLVPAAISGYVDSPAIINAMASGANPLNAANLQEYKNEVALAFGFTPTNTGAKFNYATDQMKLQTTLDSALRPLKKYSPDGASYEYEYYPWGGVKTLSEGRPFKPNDPNVAVDVPAIFQTTTYLYDAERLSSSTTDNNGAITSTQVLYRSNNDMGAYGSLTDARALGGAKKREGIVAYDWAGRPLITRSLVEALPTGTSTTAYLAEQTINTYGPFGEVTTAVNEKGHLTGDFSAADASAVNAQLRTTTNYTRDVVSGLVTKTSTQSDSVGSTDLKVYTTKEEKALSGFDATLRPTISLDTVRNIKTTTSGVPGMVETTRTWAPLYYKQSSADVVTTKTSYWDACGNLVRQIEYGVAAGIRDTQTTIGYNAGQICKPIQTSQTIANISSGYVTRFGLRSDGQVMITDAGGTPELLSNDATLTASSNLMICKRDGIGRCLQPGSQYSFNVNGGTFAFGGASVTGWHDAESAFTTAGKMLKNRQYLGDQYMERLGTISSAMDWTESNDRKGTALATSSFSLAANHSKTVLTKDGSAVSYEEGTIDPVLGNLTAVVRNKQVNSQQSDTFAEESTFDPLGRVDVTKQWKESLPYRVSFSSYYNVPKTDANLMVTSKILTRQNGKPTSVEIDTGSPGANQIVQNVTSELVEPTSDLIGKRTYTTTAGGVTRSGVETLSYDGLGVPTNLTYDHRSPSQYGGISLYSSRLLSRNGLNQMYGESIGLDDYLQPGVSDVYALGTSSQNYSREVFTARQMAVANIGYEYRARGFIMRTYIPMTDGSTASAFSDYTLSADGTIKTIQITGPNGLSYTYDNTAKPSRGNPYPRGRDYRAGEMQIDGLDIDFFGYFGTWLSGQKPSAVYLHNKGLPVYDATMQPNLLKLSFTDDFLSKVERFRDDSSGASNLALSYNVPSSRSAVTATSASCSGDEAGVRWGPTGAADMDYKTLFDAKGRVEFARRSSVIKFPTTEDHFWFDVYKAYGTSGWPEAEETVIRYGRKSTSTNNWDYPLTAQRLIETRRFVATTANAAIGGGQSYIPVGAVYTDKEEPGIGSFNVPTMPSASIYIWGPYSAPVMVFKYFQNTQSWKAYWTIFDSFGNVRGLAEQQYAGVFAVEDTPAAHTLAPKRVEQYLPFLDSVVMKYRGTGDPDFIAPTYDASGLQDTWKTTYGAAESIYAPQNLLENIFYEWGGSGALRDANNFLVFNGMHFDPYIGNFVTQDADGNRICEKGGYLTKAADFLAMETGMKDLGKEGTLDPSPVMRRMIAEQIAIIDKNLPWYSKVGGGYNPGRVGMVQSFLSEHGLKWYNESGEGYSLIHNAAYGTANVSFNILHAVCGANAERLASEGHSTAAGLSLVACTGGLVAGGLGGATALFGSEFAGPLVYGLTMSDMVANEAIMFGTEGFTEETAANSLIDLSMMGL